jgi:hypothetical protein
MIKFSVAIESFNDQGEKQRTDIFGEYCTKSEVLNIAYSLGIKLSPTHLYSMQKERMYLIETEYRPYIRNQYFITLGEFIHEPLLCIKRL